MANIITAGNSTNGGTAISTDTSGTLNIVTGSGSGANAITIDASQNVVFSGNVSGNIKSGTAVASTSGTSIDFTSIPSTIKRITVMFSGVSTSGTSTILIQLGTSSGFETTSYNSGAGSIGVAGASVYTTGFPIGYNVTAAANSSGMAIISLIGSNTWSQMGNLIRSDGMINLSAGAKALSGTLDRVRITTVNGTDTFDAGTVNILWE
jgi:hypothetical protein